MSPEMVTLLIKSFWETCYMVLASTVLATLIGIPLGVILTVTRRDHILPNAAVNGILGAIVNATRSTPFIILMVAIIPLTRIIVGSSIGTTAAIVPLTISPLLSLPASSNLPFWKSTTALLKQHKPWAPAPCRL
jgi:D-methionine transport system permease protein